MKTKILIISLFLAIASSKAQNTLWYFSDKAGTSFGIDFTGGTPSSVTTGTTINFYESLTTQSDAAGNLLWYSDGMFVYNKNHQKMPALGNAPLQGTIEDKNNNPAIASAVQGALSFKWPGSATKYLLFTTQSCDGFHTQGWRYHVIDMALNGGLGDLVSKDNLLQLNTAEMQTFVGNCDSVWVVTHGINDNNFYSVLVTANGVGNVITSTVSTVNQFDNGIADNLNAAPGYQGARGSLAINSLGNKIAMTGSWPCGTHVLNFNRYTGVVSGPQTQLFIPADGRFDGYGTEWSPDGNILYVTSFDYEKILHYNLNTNTTTKLNVSSSIAFGEIVTGPDGVLYIAKREEDFQRHLSTITNPNSTTATPAGIGFTQNGYNVGNYVQPGLPQMFTCSAPACDALDTNLNNLNVAICAAATSDLSAFVKGTTKAGTWSVLGSGANWPTMMGSIFTTTSSTPAGSYTVRYTLTSPAPGCPTYAQRTIIVKALPVVSMANKSICTGGSTTFDAGNLGATYVWSNQGTGNLQTTIASTAGTYTVSVTSNGCTTSGSATLTITAPPAVDVANKSICTGDSTTFDAGIVGATYLWSDLGTGSFQTTKAKVEGRYTITVTANGCSASDTAHLTVKAKPIVNMANQTICTGDSTTFDAGNTGSLFVWSNQGAGTAQTTTAKTAGTYTVNVTSNGCSATASATLAFKSASVNVANATICSGANTNLDAGAGYSSYSWTGPNGFTSNSQSISVSNAGTYTIAVIAANNCSATDNAIVSINNAVQPNLGDIAVCLGSSAALSAPNHNNHSWTGPNGFSSSSSSILTAAAGTYYLEATDINNCKIEDTVEVSFNPIPTLQLHGDTATCFTEHESYLITLNGTYNKIVWSDNSTGSSLLAGSPGTYWVNVSNAYNCWALDTIILKDSCKSIEPCFPNVITPNGDSFNDVFASCFPYADEKIKSMQLEIYDRWGLRLYFTTDKFPVWDGKFNGNNVTDGVYYYVVKYTNSANDSGELTGFVQVIQ